jgi:hypothetical protein
MNKDHRNLAVKLASAFLLTGVATAEQDQDSSTYYIDSTDTISMSMRFGLNIPLRFSGAGGAAYAPPSARTPNGFLYNYDNGYVLKDVSGNAGGQTVNYGYENASQVTGTPGVQQTLNLNRTSTSGQNDSLYDPRIGAELTYNHQLGIKENWHHLRFGIEVAANYTPISFADTVTGSTTQDSYYFAAGTTAPTAPFQGNYFGAGSGGSPYAILSSSPYASQTVGSFIEQQSFKADLWGFRLGPYLELPVTRKLSVHVSGGFAVGMLDATGSWSETSTASGVTTTTSGGGHDLAALYGEYARLDFAYKFNKHWGAEIGAQYQNLGTYTHDFGGRTVDLDLTQSIFVEAGISYSF